MSETIQNLQAFDPFADATDNVDQTLSKKEQHVHLRIQKRTGKKTITIIQGLPKQVDLKLILKAFKKEFCCNGTIIEDEETGDEIIQLTGDHRKPVQKFLVDEQIVSASSIKVHGY